MMMFLQMILSRQDSEYLKLEMAPIITSLLEHRKKLIFLQTQRQWVIQMPLMKSLG